MAKLTHMFYVADVEGNKVSPRFYRSQSPATDFAKSCSKYGTYSQRTLYVIKVPLAYEEEETVKAFYKGAEI